MLVRPCTQLVGVHSSIIGGLVCAGQCLAIAGTARTTCYCNQVCFSSTRMFMLVASSVSCASASVSGGGVRRRELVKLGHSQPHGEIETFAQLCWHSVMQPAHVALAEALSLRAMRLNALRRSRRTCTLRLDFDQIAKLRHESRTHVRESSTQARLDRAASGLSSLREVASAQCTSLRPARGHPEIVTACGAMSDMHRAGFGSTLGHI